MEILNRSTGFLKQDLSLYAEMVKLSHSIFALPFALSMFAVVAKRQDVMFSQLLWILVALVSARTAAMGFNRLLDRNLDALNPRTMQRELPRNAISKEGAVRLVLISSALFFAASLALGTHCLYLAPLVLAFLFFYSYTKRFTHHSHLVLGVALAMAPGGVWYALTASFDLIPVFMIAGVTFWVAGFDIIYSCQDVDFDRSHNLHSIPALVGLPAALKISFMMHICSLACLAVFGYSLSFGIFYYLGLMIFAAVLLSQHALVTPHDLSRVNAAFFTRNGLAAFIYLLTVCGETYIS